jgi:hypothetical protein
MLDRPGPHSFNAKPSCFWCQRPFSARTSGGSPQRFCSPLHRRTFFAAARAWALLAVERGIVTVETLQAAQTSVISVRTSASTPARVAPAWRGPIQGTYPEVSGRGNAR